MKKIYLYDPRYNLKTETTYKKLEGTTGLTYEGLTGAKFKRKKIRKLWYIVDEKTTKKELYKYYTEVKYKDEAWKEIIGSDGIYFISNYGRFKRYNAKNELEFILPYFRHNQTNNNPKGLQYARVKFKGVLKEYSVARLVAYHFVEYESKDTTSNIDDVFDDLVVTHKNSISHDNYHGNLEFISRSENRVRINKTTGHSIVLYDALTGEPINYFNTITEASEFLKIGYNTIMNSLLGKNSSNVVLNKYVFKYEKDVDFFIEKQIQTIDDTIKNVRTKEQTLVSEPMKVRTPIEIIDPKTNTVLRRYRSISQAARELKGDKRVISKYLDISYSEDTKLYRDKYLFKSIPPEEIQAILNQTKQSDTNNIVREKFETKQNSTPVALINPRTGEVIKKYSSLHQVTKDLRMDRDTVYKYLDIPYTELTKLYRDEFLFRSLTEEEYKELMLDQIFTLAQNEVKRTNVSTTIFVTDIINKKFLGKFRDLKQVASLCNSHVKTVEKRVAKQGDVKLFKKRYLITKIYIRKDITTFIAIDTANQKFLGSYETLEELTDSLDINYKKAYKYIEESEHITLLHDQFLLNKITVTKNCFVIAIEAETDKFIGFYKSISEASEDLKVSSWSIRNFLQNGSDKKPINKKYIFRTIDMDGNKPFFITDSKTGKFLGVYNALDAAAKEIGFDYNTFRNYIYSMDRNLPFLGKYKVVHI